MKARKDRAGIWANPTGPGWEAFETLLQAWRDAGDMEGLVLETGQESPVAAEVV